MKRDTRSGDLTTTKIFSAKTPERRQCCLPIPHQNTSVVLVSLLLTLNIFTPCSSVPVVNFEHVIAGWDCN